MNSYHLQCARERLLAVQSVVLFRLAGDARTGLEQFDAAFAALIPDQECAHPLLRKLAGACAAMEGVTADTWLRVQAMPPRRKAPASSDVCLRIRGLRAEYVGMSLVKGETPDDDMANVAIVAASGDTVCVVGGDLDWALKAAILAVGGDTASEVTDV